MSKLELIEEQIKGLSQKELMDFREWLARFDAEFWDRQFEADVSAGRLDAMAEAASREHLAGRSTKL